jgi:hypothetical protein
LICHPCAGLEPVRAREVDDAVVALVPVRQAPPDVIFGRARFEAHERVRKIVHDLVVLRREVIRFRLALLSDERGELVVLMHVVRNGAEVVEELAQQVPAPLLLHDGRASSRSPASSTSDLNRSRAPSPART